MIGVATDGHRVGPVRADDEIGEESGPGAVMLQCPVGHEAASGIAMSASSLMAFVAAGKTVQIENDFHAVTLDDDPRMLNSGRHQVIP